MLVYAGIDEAGYGPLLGPLCVACTLFVVKDHDPETGPCDLWKRLAKAVCRKRTDTRRRIAVDDSKVLKGPRDGPNHPLKALERGVLTFAAAATADDSPEAAPWTLDRELLAALGSSVSAAPWYASHTEIPLAHTADELRIAASRLRAALQNQRIEPPRLACEAIDAAAFNQQVRQMGLKSSVNFCAVLRHIDEVWRRWPSEHPRVMVDRQGGRTHYLQDLMLAWPDASVRVLSESPSLSRYRLERGDSRLTVSFQVEAERFHLPVALASMTAKYTRELLMIRLNRYFQSHLPELKPTAGYVEDGRRYLAEIESLIAQQGLERDALVRSV